VAGLLFTTSVSLTSLTDLACIKYLWIVQAEGVGLLGRGGELGVQLEATQGPFRDHLEAIPQGLAPEEHGFRGSSPRSLSDDHR